MDVERRILAFGADRIRIAGHQARDQQDPIGERLIDVQPLGIQPQEVQSCVLAQPIDHSEISDHLEVGWHFQRKMLEEAGMLVAGNVMELPHVESQGAAGAPGIVRAVEQCPEQMPKADTGGDEQDVFSVGIQSR